MTTCPKCQYIRQPGDSAPDYECPKCGVVYAKAKPSNRPLPDMWLKTKSESETATVTLQIPDAPISDVVLPTSADAEQIDPSDHLGIQNDIGQRANLLADCPCCSSPISFAALACPKCGHPNPEAANRIGTTAGIIAVALGISALWAPYLVAPLIIPAALAAIAIATYLRSHLVMVTSAAILVMIASVQTYKTSENIRKVAEAAEESAKRNARELEIFQERLRRDQSRSQEELDRALRELRR